MTFQGKYFGIRLGDEVGMEPLGVGLFGLGTVGSGVARLLIEQRDRVVRRTGRRLDLKWAVVRDPVRERGLVLPDVQVTRDASRVINDPEVGVIVETMGGTGAALDIVMAALAAGKDVVTANKALLAEHGPEIFSQARRTGRAVAFEASVGGGIPIVQALCVGLAANQIQSLSAIVNGTCNFILSSMGRGGLSYRTALAIAQEKGYAEADPTLDVDGTDTAHKLAILAQLAFGVNITTREIHRRGIDTLDPADIRYAGELGYTVKLLALAKLTDGALELRVAPRLVRQGTPLADVQGPYNAIRVVGDTVGDTLFYGQGAGRNPTASAVVGDLIDVAVGRAGLTFKALNLWSPETDQIKLAGADRVRSRYYLRFTIADRPGVLGAIAHVLGEHQISIASVIQHDPGDDTPGAPVPLVMMSHSAFEANIEGALRAIDHLEDTKAESVCLGVED
jgi:homoserine dehydrogenase